MKIGVLSDTHDHIPKIKRAVEIFNEEKVDMVLHSGDIVAPFSLLTLQHLACKNFVAVFGNNDGEREGLKKMLGTFGYKIHERPYTFAVNGYKIAMLHEPDPLNDTIDSQEYDLITFGHTHKSHVKLHGKSLVINPGEGCGWLYGTSSIGIVSLPDKTARIVQT